MIIVLKQDAEKPHPADTGWFKLEWDCCDAPPPPVYGRYFGALLWFSAFCSVCPFLYGFCGLCARIASASRFYLVYYPDNQ
jgi:hypothetical protein